MSSSSRTEHVPRELADLNPRPAPRNRIQALANRAFALAPRIAIALGLIVICGQAVAEPYSGNPRDDLAVRIVSWALLILFSITAGLLPALYRCRSDLRFARVAANTLAFAFVVVLACYLSPVFGVLSDLVSVALHLLF